MAKTYSFKNTHFAITGPGGSFSLKDGSSEEGITVAPREDRSKLNMGADGTGMHSLYQDKSCTVTVRLLKNSPVNALLSGLYNFQTENSSTHGQNTITITSEIGDAMTISGAAFKRHPDVGYNKDGAPLEWVFEAIEFRGVLANSII